MAHPLPTSDPTAAPPSEWPAEPACAGQMGWFEADWGENVEVCLTECPVRGECLTYALSFGFWDQPEGVWAGLSARERRTLIRRKKARLGERIGEPETMSA